MTKVVVVLDIDSTLADNSHRKYLLKEYCARCGSLAPIGTFGNQYKVCMSCDCDVFNKPLSSYVDYAEPRMLALDSCVGDTQYIVRNLSDRCDIHYITARAKDAYEVTEQWLKDNYSFDSAKNKLITRDTNSYYDRIGMRVQPAEQYKREAFEKLKRLCNYTGDEFFIFIDDNRDVLDMYAEYGLTLKAPECWSILDIRGMILGPEISAKF